MGRAGLSRIDWLVVAAYLLLVLVLGLKASGRQRSTRDYFLGDRSLPWWAVALSIIATETSAATYIGTPGIAYRSSWHYLQMVLGFVLGRLFLALFFIPVYYRSEMFTVYGFLKERFGEPARLVAALLFISGRVVASGVRLYAACLAVTVAAGAVGQGPVTFLAIGLLGFLALAYTFLGGIKAVVWTECVLGTTLLLGGLVAALAILARIPGGLSAAAALPEFGEKLRVFHLSPPPEVGWAAWLRTTEPFWIGLGGGFVLNLATHGTDQDMVQRMLTCRDWKRGGLSILASAVLILPLNLVFLSVGSLLYFYHRLIPEARPPGVENGDDYLLLFIAREMPVGLAGLVLAGLFAAAISSHTSVLNALSSTTLADFYRPHLVRRASERHYLAASRAFTALWALVLVLVAWGFVGSQRNVLVTALSSLTYFYGSLLGAFLLGIFTRRGSAASATLGMVLAVPVVLVLQLREFVGNEELAPPLWRSLIHALPPGWLLGVRAGVPELAWPLWIVVGTAVAFGVGALAPAPGGRPAPAAPLAAGSPAATGSPPPRPSPRESEGDRAP